MSDFKQEYLNTKIQQNIKTLSQVEADKKQKIIFKPNTDRFFQPLVLILGYFAIILLTIGLIITAYSYSSYTITGSLISYEEHTTVQYTFNFPLIQIAAYLLFVSAGLFLVCFLIRLFRGIHFVNINKEVKLEDVGSKLLTKFATRFVLYVFFLCAIVTIALIGANNTAVYNNQMQISATLKMLGKYWYLSAIFSIISGSVLVTYISMEATFYLKNIFKRYFLNKKDDPEIIAMVNHKRNESYVKLLINKILVIMFCFSVLIFIVSLFIYGTDGLNYAYNYLLFERGDASSLLNAPFITNLFNQFSIALYITGGLFCFSIIYAIYVLVINYKINNYERTKEEKSKKERARIEKINMKTERKMHKSFKN